MLLVIDGGNTNIVFGLRQGKDQFLNWRKSTDPAFTADDYASWLAFHLKSHDYTFADITGIMISTVVPETLPALRRFAGRYIDAPCYVLTADDLSHGVTIAIDKPEQAGATFLNWLRSATLTRSRTLLKSWIRFWPSSKPQLNRSCLHHHLPPCRWKTSHRRSKASLKEARSKASGTTVCYAPRLHCWPEGSAKTAWPRSADHSATAGHRILNYRCLSSQPSARASWASQPDRHRTLC